MDLKGTCYIHILYGTHTCMDFNACYLLFKMTVKCKQNVWPFIDRVPLSDQAYPSVILNLKEIYKIKHYLGPKNDVSC